jgi:hypothetical protein
MGGGTVEDLVRLLLAISIIGACKVNLMKRKPFWLIDGKLCEADFFLDKMLSAPSLDEARYYFSAFVSACRSVTFAIQATLHKVDDFKEWWPGKQKILRNNALASYLKGVRDQVTHVGLNPLGIHRRGMFSSEFLFVGGSAPEENAGKAAMVYMELLVDIAMEAFAKYWFSLDLPNDLTVAMIQEQGRTLEDIEEEFGLPRGWSEGGNKTPDARLELLKVYSRTEICRLVAKYSITRKVGF